MSDCSRDQRSRTMGTASERGACHKSNRRRCAVSRNRTAAVLAMACAALASAPVALAAGGAGGGGGGGTTTCRPLVTQVSVVHADSGESGVGVAATVSDCTAFSQQHIHLN